MLYTHITANNFGYTQKSSIDKNKNNSSLLVQNVVFPTEGEYYIMINIYLNNLQCEFFWENQKNKNKMVYSLKDGDNKILINLTESNQEITIGFTTYENISKKSININKFEIMKIIDNKKSYSKQGDILYSKKSKRRSGLGLGSQGVLIIKSTGKSSHDVAPKIVKNINNNNKKNSAPTHHLSSSHPQLHPQPHPQVNTRIIPKPVNTNLQNMLFNSRGIFQVNVSYSLRHFKERFKHTYNLKDYTDKNTPALFFGMYNKEDIHKLSNHCEKKYILWGGTDADIRFKDREENLEKIKQYENIIHFSTSRNLEERLLQAGIQNERIEINMTDIKLFVPTDEMGDKIYIYNGFTKGNEDIYGKEIYDIVTRKLPEFTYIFSNTLNVPYEKMPEIYSQCFVGLRLTKNDGNANTVQEMNAMNIPVICNCSYSNCISWENSEDVVNKIIKCNIESFNKFCIKKKKLLFVCTDHPSYGGAATNTYNLIIHFRSLGCLVCGLFITKQPNVVIKEDGIFVCTEDNINISNITDYLHGDPLLIIIRNNISTKILDDNFECKKFFLLPGLFTNDLDIPLTDKNMKTAIKKFVHAGKIRMISKCDKTYVGSKLTKDILKKYFNIDADVLYFNGITSCSGTVNETSSRREYDVGFIVSDLTRKIKNAKFALEIMRQLPSHKKIVIGKNVEKFKVDNDSITFLDLVSNETVKKYLTKINILIVPSFYESCSNIIIEAKNAGCKIIANNVCNNSLSHIDYLMNDYDVINWSNTIIENTKKSTNFVLIYNGFSSTSLNIQKTGYEIILSNNTHPDEFKLLLKSCILCVVVKEDDTSRELCKYMNNNNIPYIIEAVNNEQLTENQLNVINTNILNNILRKKNHIIFIGNYLAKDSNELLKTKEYIHSNNSNITTIYLNNSNIFIHDYGNNVKIVNKYNKYDIKRLFNSLSIDKNNDIIIFYCHDMSDLSDNLLENIREANCDNGCIIPTNITSQIFDENTTNIMKLLDACNIVLCSNNTIIKHISDNNKLHDILYNALPNSKIQHVYDTDTIKKYKIFINFSPKDSPYGGGNQFANGLIKYFNTVKNIKVTDLLEKDTDICIIIDPRKDGIYKKYTIDEILAYFNDGKTKIIQRINDCDITRGKKELEDIIIKNIGVIDRVVFNSSWIQSYYTKKYDIRNKCEVIYNTCDPNIFYPISEEHKFSRNHIRIVTHHWSSNINKGYVIYEQLYNYCKKIGIEFIIIGRKLPDIISTKIPLIGPYSGKELGDQLRKCDIYITASEWDACPMHVIEGISCGLPILYYSKSGGGKCLCELPTKKIGEEFSSFDDLVEKLNIIIENYDTYRRNILDNLKLYNSDCCYSKFFQIIQSLLNLT